MRKHMKKAVSFLMAVCLLTGSGYTGEASTSVSVTSVTQEMATETQTEPQKKENILGNAWNAVKNWTGRVADSISTAYAAEEEKEEEAKYEYVLRFTGLDAIIKNGSRNAATMSPKSRDTLYVSSLKVGTENEFGSLGNNIKIKFEVGESSKDILTIIDDNENDYSFDVYAKKPGWATLYGRIWEVDENGNEIKGEDFFTTFLVKAELDRGDEAVWKDIDVNPTPDTKILVLDPTVMSEYQLRFEGINSEDISKSSEVSDSIKFVKLPSASVVKMDEDMDGLLKIVGSGMTTFSIQNYVAIEIDGEDAQQQQNVGKPYEVTVIVLPTGAEEGKAVTDYKKSFSIDVEGQPGKSGSDFTIQTYALDAENFLIWEVYYGLDGEKKLVESHVPKELGETPKQEPHSLFKYYFEGNKINFTDVKAGTYQIKAYVTKEYSKVDYLTIDVVVWLNLQSGEYYVNVGDYYDIMANSNIPEGMFERVYSCLPLGTEGSAKANPTTGIINALAYGSDSFELSYKETAKLYTKENAAKLSKIKYTIQVIDTLSISPSSAIMYTGGELTLKANTTQHGTIYWDYGAEADKEFIEISTNGVVKAKKKTPDKYEATVVAYQIIGGVTKRAECKIQVYETAAKIQLEPAEVEINVGATKTIEAILTPNNLNSLNLRWQSMNAEIFDVSTEIGDTSIQIIGKAPGTATLIAINEDNGEMGYCKVTVKAGASGITISDTKITGLEGETWQLEANVTPAEATNKELDWWSVDTSIARVNKYGKVTFVKEGTTVINVRSKDNPELQASCTVVVSKMLSGINILEDTEIEMYVGESHTIPYKIVPENASDKTVTWESFNTNVVTVDGEGKLTARAPGSAMVMVMSNADPSIYVMISVRVKQKAVSVKMNYTEIIMNRGEYFDMEVTIAPATSTEASLIWESLDPAIATVSSTGRITARAAGTATVLVRTQSGVTSYCKVKVLEPVTSLELDPKEVVIDVGEVFRIDTEFKPEEPSNMEVKWTTSNSQVVTVNALGEVKGITRGSAVITCESIDGGFRAFCLVTVVNPDIVVEIKPDTYRLGHGKTYTLVATVKDKGKVVNNVELVWSSSDEDVCTVDSNGKIFGNDYGKATITAMIDEDEYEIYATCEVEVVREVTSIRLNHTVLTIIQGHTASLKADVQPQDADYTNVDFSTEDKDIAVVDEDGVITALKPGNVWIWAKAQDNSGKAARCWVTVIEPVPATGITVSDKKVVLVPGEKKQMNFTTKPNNSTDTVTWTAGEETIATVDGSGLITAHRTGTTTVTAMTTSGKTTQVEVIVLGLSRETLEIPIYTKYSRLTVDGATGTVRWDVEDQTICEINNGEITARKAGTTYVSATINGRTLKCKVTVLPNKKK